MTLIYNTAVHYYEHSFYTFAWPYAQDGTGEPVSALSTERLGFEGGLKF